MADQVTTFMDCPEYMNGTGRIRCGLPAEVKSRYTMASTDGPLESAIIRCPRGHWFNGPVEFLAIPAEPSAAAGQPTREGTRVASRSPVPRAPGRRRRQPGHRRRRGHGH